MVLLGLVAIKGVIKLMGIRTKLFPMGQVPQWDRDKVWTFTAQPESNKYFGWGGDHSIYNLEIDWGDGSPIQKITAPTDYLYHIYPDTNRYKVTLYNKDKQMPNLFRNADYGFISSYNSPLLKMVDKTGAPVTEFNLSSGLNRIDDTEISNFPEDLFINNQQITKAICCFANTSITQIPMGILATLPNLIDVGGMFQDTLIEEVPANVFVNNPNIQSANSLFAGCTNLTTIQDYAFYNLENLQQIDRFFSGCSSLVEVPPHTFRQNLPLTASAYMCDSCTSLTHFNQLPLFESCERSIGPNMLSGDPEQNNGAEINITSSFFYGCKALAEIPSGFFNGLATIGGYQAGYGGGYVFQGCESITEIPTDIFSEVGKRTDPNFKSLKYFSYSSNMFQNCTGLTTIPEEIFANVANDPGDYGNGNVSFDFWFSGCTNLTGQAPELWNMRNAEGYTCSGRRCFRDCTNLSNYGDVPDTWK